MTLRRLLSELKRRQVYRAMVVYATLAWVLLEGSDLVVPRLGLPDETIDLVLLLTLLGFPVAVVLAWIFDISPEGISRTPPLSPKVRHHFSWARLAEFVLIGLLIAVVGYLYVDRLALQREIASPPPQAEDSSIPRDPGQYRSIAVLPFADMSEGGDQSWFAEGVAEELLHALARVEDLHVVARTSSFAFRDSGKTIAEIAEILGVQAVLEGSLRRSGDRVRITAQLIDAKNGYHIWSESYERQLNDIFQLQDELALSIVRTLELELGVERTVPLVAQQTTVPEAYNAFVRGRTLLDFANLANIYQSINYLETAVGADPDYAKAWGHLALARLYTVFWLSTAWASDPVTAAYERALALDPAQSEALTAKALLTQLRHRDWDSAADIYQQALLADENAYAKTTYAMFYLTVIEVKSLALDLLQEAEQRDPLQAGYKSNLAFFHLWDGNTATAIAKAREALALHPQHVFATMALIEGYTLAGDCEAALTIFEGLPSNIQKAPRVNGRAALCYARLGDTARAEEIYNYIQANTPTHHAIMQQAVLAAEFGDMEAAVDAIEHEVKNHSWNQLFIRTYFRHQEAFANHPRYLALLEEVGLDDQSLADLRERLSFD